METRDDDLQRFEADGAEPLPPADTHGWIEHEGAAIWYAAYGAGSPVLLLHGALGNSEDWGYQVPALLAAGHRPVLIDNRGRGHSTRGSQPFTYELMAAEVLKVMDALNIQQTAVVGWSDGAIIGLLLAMQSPARISRVFAFGGNMDLSGVRPVSLSNPIIARVFGRSAQDYERLSSTPYEFDQMSTQVDQMLKTQPNYSAADLAAIRTPIAIVAGENDEFIKREHTEYLARTIPGAKLTILPAVSHFAPLQRPTEFNAAMLDFL
jgi:pimeloyl-ACP methyl ester carboxylesterase